MPKRFLDWRVMFSRPVDVLEALRSIFAVVLLLNDEVLDLLIFSFQMALLHDFAIVLMV